MQNKVKIVFFAGLLLALVILVIFSLAPLLSFVFGQELNCSTLGGGEVTPIFCHTVYGHYTHSLATFVGSLLVFSIMLFGARFIISTYYKKFNRFKWLAVLAIFILYTVFLGIVSFVFR